MIKKVSKIPQSNKPSFWLRLVLPLALVLVWLIVGAFGGSTFGKISSVSTNDQAAFLPASAESTKVNELQSKFVKQQSIPAIIVIESSSQISQNEQVAFKSLKSKLTQVDGVLEPEGVRQPTVIGPILSEDRHAAQLIVPINANAEVAEVVKALREVINNQILEDQRVYVTGPAGLSADLINAFGGIDSILLFVALGVVFVILLAVYRSILLPIIVLLNSILALSGAIWVIYYLAMAGVIELSGQSQGILSILVIGAATDYSLLLVARFREHLETEKSKFIAIKQALQGVVEPISASAATVILALLCLLFSELNSNRSLGPIAAIGIFFAFLTSLSFLPSLLALFGRNSFWPFKPQYKGIVLSEKSSDIPKLWHKVGYLIAYRSRVVWSVCLIFLLIGTAGITQLRANGVATSDLILGKSEAVAGQAIITEHFNTSIGAPVIVIAEYDKAEAVVKKLESLDQITQVQILTGSKSPTEQNKPVVIDGMVLINASLRAYESTSEKALIGVEVIREELDAVDQSSLVGGRSAIALDTNLSAIRDLKVIIPIVLAVVLLILIVVLRSLLAPLILILTVALSYTATIGISAFVFNNLFNFPGADASVPLFGFVFLVALGVDYNIFLMTRAREESVTLGTRKGLLRALGKTGSVITSAGVVLAATFAALGVIPILFLVQLAFIVAFGVLLDTILVRSLLVPALCYDIGKAIWWPSKLWHDLDT